jgi:CSLREA domain-containing protein
MVLTSFRLLRIAGLLLLVAALSLVLATPTPVQAVTFTVDTLVDENDGSCDDDCSLRDAILLANANGQKDTIEFSVAGTIAISGALGGLPPLSEEVILDGTTAPGYAGTPLVFIDGSSVGAADGMHITSSGNTLTGLAIHSFGGSCVLVDDSDWNIIGPEMVMSDCGTGVRMQGSFAELNTIQDSFIGTDVTGMSAWPNGWGVVMWDGPTLNEVLGNVISGNDSYGIWLTWNNTYQNEVRGNYIGVAADGVTPLGNGAAGISIEFGSFENYIGGDGPGEGNIIAHNASAIPDTGIVITGDDSDTNLISRNSIYDNTDLGIDLGDDGVTCDAVGDGPNDLTHCPVITSATTSVVSGTACPDCTVEVFVADPDPSGYGEGKTFVGAADADGSGNFSVSVSGVNGCDWLTATATEDYNNTSEFSENVQVPCAYIDKDITNGEGPCDPDYIDDETTEVVGSEHELAVCIGGLSEAVGAFDLGIRYDDELDECTDVECKDAVCLDDNPDANAGNTTWGDGLGDGWDCTYVPGEPEPICDMDEDTGPQQGHAQVWCVGTEDYDLGDDESWGVLAVLTLDVVAGGTDDVVIDHLTVYRPPDGGIIGDCDEGMDCLGARDIKVTPTPTEPPSHKKTPTPTVTATPTEVVPTATSPPPPVPTATPFGGPSGIVVAPPPTGTGSGSSGTLAIFLSSVAGLGALMAGGGWLYLRSRVWRQGP